MSELSFNQNLSSMSDQALLGRISRFVKTSRLDQNKSQDVVSKAANISRSTLSLLERGQTVTLSTLIQVLRVLDIMHVLNDFEVKRQISPLQLAVDDRNKRMRARARKSSNSQKGDW